MKNRSFYTRSLTRSNSMKFSTSIMAIALTLFIFACSSKEQVSDTGGGSAASAPAVQTGSPYAAQAGSEIAELEGKLADLESKANKAKFKTAKTKRMSKLVQQQSARLAETKSLLRDLENASGE